jgi:carboxyl-terminal processing protease
MQKPVEIKKYFKKKLRLITLFLSLMITGTFSVFAQQNIPFLEELKLFSTAIGAVMEGYVAETKPRELLYEALKGMLASLDPYSQFIDPKTYELMKISMSGEYAGIGTWIKKDGQFIIVEKVRPGSSAELAGVMAEDRILAIDGVMTEGKLVEEVGAILRGEENTEVELLIQRLQTAKVFSLKIKREKIEIDAVEDVRIVGKSIGYMRLSGWQEKTITQMDKSLEDLKAQGMQALILDLRNNQGGLLTQAVALAEHFLPAGKEIVEVKSKIDVQAKTYVTTGGKVVYDIPMVILVNQGSASASEIFSACMQDHTRATLVGMKTFGKASVQSVIPLDEKSAMKLTTARYLSPLGRVIDGKGIEPDIAIENATEESPNGQFQIKAAIKILQKYY